MSRNISFSMTADQIRNRSKTVTRRLGWWFLQSGDVLQGVEKAMGLKKGERIKKLVKIKVVSARKEPLSAVTQEDVVREGFPDWTPCQFIKMMTDHCRISPETEVNRIEFEYLREHKQLKLFE